MTRRGIEGSSRRRRLLPPCTAMIEAVAATLLLSCSAGLVRPAQASLAHLRGEEISTSSPLPARLYTKEVFSTSDSACALACVNGGLAGGGGESACSRNALEMEIWVYGGIGARVVGAELEVWSVVEQDEDWLQLTTATDANLEVRYAIRPISSVVAEGGSVADGSSFTISVGVDLATASEFISLVLLLEGCGLISANILGTAVSAIASVGRGDDDGHNEEWGGTNKESSSRVDEGLSLHQRKVGQGGDVVGESTLLQLERKPLEHIGADGGLLRLKAAAGVVTERIGAAQVQQQPEPSRERKLRGSRNLQEEECSAACLTHSTQTCYNDPDCATGGLGCNALDDPLCRFCGFEGFGACPELPTNSPAATPAPTEVSNRQECSASCLTAKVLVCYDDPSCSIGGLGCNARGDFYCRFCGFDDFHDCPFTPTPATPAPVTVPTVAPGDVPTTAPLNLPTTAPLHLPTNPPLYLPTNPPLYLPTNPPLYLPTNPPLHLPTTVPSVAPQVATVSPSTVVPNPIVTFAPVIAAPPTSAPNLVETVAPTTAATIVPSAAPVSLSPVAAVTTAPSGAAATNVPVAATTSVPTAAPTLSREIVIPPIVTVTRAPTVEPTAAQTAVPTAGPISAANAEFISGSLSAIGVSDPLIAEKGRDTLVQEAVCAITECAGGPESIVVVPSSRRRWLASPSSMLLSVHNRRRLVDFEDVEWQVPSASASNLLTGSEQAAQMFKNMASPEMLQQGADALGINVDDLSFEGLTYFQVQQQETTIMSDFEALTTAGVESDSEASTWSTVVVAVVLIGVMLMLCCCLFWVIKAREDKKHRTERLLIPNRRMAKFSSVNDEDGFEVKKNPMANRSVTPSRKGALIRSSSPDMGASTPSAHVQKIPLSASSLSETGSQFACSNPMHKESSSRTVSAKSNDEDLAQHYEGYDDTSSAMSSELPSNKTNNPLFEEGTYSPRSKVAASTARENTSAMITGGDSTVFGSSSSLNPFFSDGGGGSSLGGAGEGRLSPVVEVNSSTTGSAPSTLNPSQHQQQHDSVASSRALSLAPPSSAGYNSETDDDDAQSVFRATSPGAVSRPLLPLMASNSPLSCATSLNNSRSNSFASPTPDFDMVGQSHRDSGRRNMILVPVVIGGGNTFYKGAKALKDRPESLEDPTEPVNNTEAVREVVDAAIQNRDKTGDLIECDKVRQAVRDAVRQQRVRSKNVTRSVSHEAHRMPPHCSSPSFDEYPSPRDGTPMTGGGSFTSGSDYHKVVNRAKSLSPAARRRGSMGSPDLGRLTSGSSISRASSADSGFGRIGDRPLSPITGQQNSADAAAGVRPSPSVCATAAAATGAAATAATKHHGFPAPSTTKTDVSPATSLIPALTTERAEAAAGASTGGISSTNTSTSTSSGGATGGVSSTNTSTSTSSTGDELVHGSTGATAVRSTGSGSIASSSSGTNRRRPSPGGSGLKFTSIGRKMSREKDQAASGSRSATAAGGTGTASIAARGAGAASLLTDIPAPSAREPGTITTMRAVVDAADAAATEGGGAGARLTSGHRQRQPPPAYGDEGFSAVLMKGTSTAEAAAGRGGAVVTVATTKALPASALRGSGSFSTREPRSVSFADYSDSNSDYEPRLHEEGRAAYGTGATLRQHLADPSRPSGSYRRHESEDSLSEESISPTYRGGGGASSPSAFTSGTGTAYSTATGSVASGVSSSGFSVTSSYTQGSRGGYSSVASSSTRAAKKVSYSRRYSSGGSSLSSDLDSDEDDGSGRGQARGQAIGGRGGVGGESGFLREWHNAPPRSIPSEGDSVTGTAAIRTRPPADSAGALSSNTSTPSSEYSRLFSSRGRSSEGGGSGTGGNKRRMQMG